jgi:hypothetical protein
LRHSPITFDPGTGVLTWKLAFSCPSATMAG